MFGRKFLDEVYGSFLKKIEKLEWELMIEVLLLILDVLKVFFYV